MRFLALLLALSGPVAAQDITAARLEDPTGRYDHGILGDSLEWGALALTLTGGKTLRFTLPATHVFEDITARLGDFDGDGQREVMVVETSIAKGAALAIYDAQGRRAATPSIGQTHRWLAPAGWGDFDGDGQIEIAYVDRPHLAKELVFLRLRGRTLTEIARLRGVTNHRIGDNHISGGVAHCNGQDSLIVAKADWSGMVAVRLGPDGPLATDLQRKASAKNFAAALTCR